MQFGFVEEKTDGAINYNDKMDSEMTVQKGIDAVAKSKAKVALADAEGRYLTDTGKFSLEKYASENPLGGPTCEICGRPRNPQLLSVCCFDCESSMDHPSGSGGTELGTSYVLSPVTVLTK